MKLRKLRKFKQEQQGWPTTIKIPSIYDYADFWCEKGWKDEKFVHPAATITSWRNCEWRGLA